MSFDAAKEGTWPLASRLTAWYSFAAFILLIALAVVLDWGLSASLESETAMLAERERQELSRILNTKPLDFGEVREEVERNQDENAQTRVWVRVAHLAGGTERVESRGMSILGLKEELVPFGDESTSRWVSGARIRLSSGTSVRAFSALETLSDGSRYGIQIFIDGTHLERIEGDYRRRAVRLLAFAFCGFSLIGYAIARHGLAPLRRIVTTMADIRSTTMDRRVERSGLPQELWILATAFNDVLDRLDDAFARLERSAADIAHELRTPLTRMRLAVEFALNSSTSPEQGKDALRNCLEEASGLTQLFERVLFLSRADEPFAPEHGELIDVEGELRQVADFYEAPATDCGIAVSTHVVPPVQVRGDRGLLLRAISNLIENSMSHTPKGGSIELRASRRDGAVELSIHDSGCGIPEEELSRIFEPFARVDVARSSEAGGAGLGLAIVKKIVALHRGAISIASSLGTGTTVTITLPSA